jgi:hypothetical protein
MDRTTVVFALLATLVSVGASLSGCGSPPRPGEHKGHLIQPPTTEGPFCAQRPFGDVKSGEMQHSVAQASTEPVAIASDDHPSDAGKLLVLSHPLEPLPLEVARIRRGMVKRFTGKFIKDGVTAWSAIDLERLVAVSIERRVFDFRSHQSRQVPDPVFSQVEQLDFARKWTDGQRTEVEVVKVFPITVVEAQLFVCAANPLWADKSPLAENDDEAGEMSPGVTDVFLLDRRQAQDLSYKYIKPIDMSENLAGILGSVWAHAPRGPDW